MYGTNVKTYSCVYQPPPTFPPPKLLLIYVRRLRVKWMNLFRASACNPGSTRGCQTVLSNRCVNSVWQRHIQIKSCVRLDPLISWQSLSFVISLCVVPFTRHGAVDSVMSLDYRYSSLMINDRRSARLHFPDVAHQRHVNAVCLRKYGICNYLS